MGAHQPHGRARAQANQRVLHALAVRQLAKPKRAHDGARLARCRRQAVAGGAVLGGVDLEQCHRGEGVGGEEDGETRVSASRGATKHPQRQRPVAPTSAGMMKVVVLGPKLAKKKVNEYRMINALQDGRLIATARAPCSSEGAHSSPSRAHRPAPVRVRLQRVVGARQHRQDDCHHRKALAVGRQAGPGRNGKLKLGLQGVPGACARQLAGPGGHREGPLCPRGQREHGAAGAPARWLGALGGHTRPRLAARLLPARTMYWMPLRPMRFSMK